MYNNSINAEYVKNQLMSTIGERLGYSFEVEDITIIPPDLKVDYVRDQTSCEFTVKVKYNLDGRTYNTTLVYPYELNDQFVFSRSGFNAKPKVAIVVGIYNPVIQYRDIGVYFTYDHFYYDTRKQDQEYGTLTTEELDELGVKPIKYQGEYYSIESFMEAFPDFKLHPRTVARARMIAKDRNLSDSFDEIVGTILDADKSQFDDINILDIDFEDAASALSRFLYENRGKIAYKIRSQYESKGKADLNVFQSYIYKGFQANTSTSLQSPSVSNPISLQSNKKKLYILKYNKDRNTDQITLKYNQSLFGAICPLKTIESAKVNIKNEVSSGMEFVDGVAYIQVYDRNLNKTRIDLTTYVMSKVLTSESWDYEANVIMENPTYIQYGKIIKWTSKEPLDWDYLHMENGEYSVALSEIPMINSTDSSRAMLGAHMLDQALPVNGGESPIVYTEGMAKNITEDSKYSGTLTKIRPDGVEITNDHGTFFQYYPEAKHSAFHSQCYYKCMKKVGDSVSSDEPLFVLQGFENGLKVGVNVNVAYMHVGYDYEDGIAIRKGIAHKFAHKMKTEIVKEFVDWEPNGITDDRFIGGLIRVGTIVNRGDPIIRGSTKLGIGRISRLFESGNSVEADTIYPLVHKGVVTDVRVLTNDEKLLELWKGIAVREHGSDKTRFIIKIDYDNVPKVGDKFTNLYGSKGVCCKIIDDEEMFRTEDGLIVDAIVSPTSTIGRKGLSQLKSAFLADCAKKLWSEDETAITNGNLDLESSLAKLKALTMSTRFDNMSEQDFIKFHNSTADIKSYRIRSKTIETRYNYNKLKELESLFGVDLRQQHTLHNNQYTVKEKITVNTQYLTRLHFIVEDKSTATADKYRRDLQLDIVNNRSSGQKIGEQELLAFMAQGMDPSQVLKLERSRVGEEFMLQMLLLNQSVTEVPD